MCATHLSPTSLRRPQARTADDDLEFLTRGVFLCSIQNASVHFKIFAHPPSLPSALASSSGWLEFRAVQTCSTVSPSTYQRVIITRVMARRPAPIYSSLDLGESPSRPLPAFLFPISLTPSQLDLTAAQHTYLSSNNKWQTPIRPAKSPPTGLLASSSPPKRQGTVGKPGEDQSTRS